VKYRVRIFIRKDDGGEVLFGTSDGADAITTIHSVTTSLLADEHTDEDPKPWRTPEAHPQTAMTARIEIIAI
jgi:hypothetical protein